MSPMQIRRLESLGAREIRELSDLLTDCVEGGASVSLSRAVFARYLRTNVRTVENWEQGRAKPNAQAAVLLKLVERYPDTVKRLEAL